MEPAATPAPSTGFAGMLARLAVPERKFPPQSELISEADWLEDDVAVISYESALKSRARRWGVDPIADQRDGLHHFTHADETDVGAPKMRVCDACSGDVQRLEAGALGNQRGERIVHAGREQDRAALEPFGQSICSHVHNPK